MIVKWIYTNIEVRNSSLICFKHFVHLRNKACPSLNLYRVINVVDLCLELYDVINDGLDRDEMRNNTKYIIILVCIVLRLIRTKHLFESNTLS